VTVSANYHVVEQRLAAFWDGFVPFYDPFDGLYGNCFECKWSRTIGEVTFGVEATLASSASATLFRPGTWMNSGINRLGFTRLPGGGTGFGYRGPLAPGHGVDLWKISSKWPQPWKW